MRDLEKAKKLIDAMNNGVVSAYKVFKETGIPQTTLGGLKNGKTSIDQAFAINVEKMAIFYDGYINK